MKIKLNLREGNKNSIVPEAVFIDFLKIHENDFKDDVEKSLKFDEGYINRAICQYNNKIIATKPTLKWWTYSTCVRGVDIAEWRTSSGDYPTLSLMNINIAIDRKLLFTCIGTKEGMICWRINQEKVRDHIFIRDDEPFQDFVTPIYHKKW